MNRLALLNSGAVREGTKRREGFRLEPYLDTEGHWTWGAGHNLDDEPLPPEILRLVLKGERELAAERLLTHDLEDAVNDCEAIFGAQEFYDLPDSPQMALVDMAFTMGQRKLRGFRKMILAVKRGDWPEAGRQALDSVWQRKLKDLAQKYHYRGPTRAEEIAALLREG